ncbi:MULTISPECIES: hypothetical protein [Nocardia]|uniref:hypothetical protein n=1 Tax=Nocardia TaxID=1817 RepID=UPI0007EBA3BB|nr:MULTISPECIES: hypothetical protein [Nocardia]MBF6273167.1 hypothetical protein [Nocardia nova]OBA41432.1 hypothetical protein A5789_15675 [Nocardia sp. 852002-51101_SCH5132738]OBB38702.1 hypothetical protein A5748_02365 [Nocardia sp. 852002-51244_SCH5132740]OBF74049.1 hypothetical protein A9X06_26955 [Mycobacterium sp. 852002-51759_SCH5129042]
MNNPTPSIRLSAIQVRWSASDRLFVASSSQYPALGYRHESSLAAVNGLIDTICEHLGARAPAGPDDS